MTPPATKAAPIARVARSGVRRWSVVVIVVMSWSLVLGRFLRPLEWKYEERGLHGWGRGHDSRLCQRPKAHAIISGNSARQNGPPCDPGRSFMTTSAPSLSRADFHRVAFLRKNG